MTEEERAVLQDWMLEMGVVPLLLDIVNDPDAVVKVVLSARRRHLPPQKEVPGVIFLVETEKLFTYGSKLSNLNKFLERGEDQLNKHFESTPLGPVRFNMDYDWFQSKHEDLDLFYVWVE